ncbi:MAG: hypothetical protein ACUVS6_13720 [Anaerolineae bacterium]
MGLATETVTYHDIQITVSEATVLQGTRRGVLRGEALRLNVEDEPPERWLLRVITYPDLVAATVEVRGIPWPLEFADFCGLPERLVNDWSEAVYRLNPHWRPTTETDQKNG